VLTANPQTSGLGSIAVDQNGSLFVSGRFCGAETPSSGVNAVVRLNSDGTLTIVAGGGGGLPTAGLSALAVSLAETPVIAFDTPVAGQRQSLYLGVPSAYYVARVDGATQRLDQIAGTGAAGSSGNFGPATSATFNLPLQLAFRPGTRDLYLAQGSGYGVGMIAGANPAVITSAIASGAAAPVNVYPDQAQSQGLLLKDGSGAILAGRTVKFALDPGRLPGGSISTLQALTGGDGKANVTAAAGLALGTYGVIASATDIHGNHVAGSPLSLPFNAVTPPAGLVFSPVGQSHVAGTDIGVSIPGATARISGPRSIAVASTGTAYFSDGNNQIYVVQPSGLASVLLPNSWGYQPWGLALDESKGVLYFSDVAPGPGYVRALKLATGALSVVAGSPTGTSADGPATATIIDPSRLRFIGGKIYARDANTSRGTGRLRRIDPVAGTIETFMAQSSSTALPAAPAVTSCVGTGPLVFQFCSQDEFTCSVAAAPPLDGRLYVSATFCGAPVGGGGIPAIVRVELDGSLTLIAKFDAPAAIATDAAGNLYLLKSNGTTAHFGYYPADTNGSVGPGAAFVPTAQGAVGAEYVDLSATSFSYAIDIFFGANHLWVADRGLNAVRIIW
jgi:hypothetical protein